MPDQLPASFIPDAAPAAASMPASFVPDGPDGATFASSNEKDASGAAVVKADPDPNTLGTFARHLWAGVNPIQLGQMLPWPKELGGSGLDNPLAPHNVVKSLMAVKREADAALKQGDYVGAVAKYVESVVPILGPMMAHQGNQLQAGQYAAAAGDVAGLAASAAAGTAASGALDARFPLATHPAATAVTVPPVVGFAEARGVPLDAGTVTPNWAVKGVQELADRSLGGSLVATPARARQVEAMARVGDELATEAHAVPMTPESGGLALRKALEQKAEAHGATANTAYDTLRQVETDPANQMAMPVGKAEVDALAPGTAGQLRRMVHELDASPFTPYRLRQAEKGGSLEHVEGTGGAGAAVYTDIADRLNRTSNPTRGAVQNALEEYLAGGKPNDIVQAAIKVAEERGRARGGNTVSVPELPPSAMDVPTRLEKTRVTSREMGFPVDTTTAKADLQPVYDQMRRQMPIAQQQANPGLKAIQNIIEGPDYAPLSQVDRDLSAIKAVARKEGGLAKLAVAKLEAAVSAAAAAGGPDVAATLQRGRAATRAKYAVLDVLDTLRDEPVKAIGQLTAPKDGAIQQLRAVAQHVPDQVPVIARAYLEDLLARPQKVADWKKLGTHTKKILFPKEGQTEALDQFFELTRRISAKDVNPSHSGYMAALGAQGAMVWYDPLHAAGIQIAGAVVAKLLRSPVAIRALTRGLTLPVSAPAAARSAATLNLVRAAQSAGVPLALPTAARAEPTE